MAGIAIGMDFWGPREASSGLRLSLSRSEAKLEAFGMSQSRRKKADAKRSARSPGLAPLARIR